MSCRVCDHLGRTCAHCRSSEPQCNIGGTPDVAFFEGNLPADGIEGGDANYNRPSHHLLGTDKAPEETAIEKIEEPGTSIVAHSPSEDSYSNKGCRCEQCRAAHRAYRMAQRRSRGVQEARRGRTHGSVGTYRNLPCRCSLCREAAVAYQAEYAARRKGAGK